MLNYSFLCRPSKIGNPVLGLAPVELCINLSGKRTYIQLPLKAKPEDFKKAMAGKGHPEIQNYMAEVRTKLTEIQTSMMAKNIPLEPRTLKEFFKNGCVDKPYTLNDLKEEYFGILKKRVGVNLSELTYQRYEKAWSDFMSFNRLPPDLAAEAVGQSHIANYKAELYSRMGIDSAGGWLKKIKTIFKYAFEAGYIKSNPGYFVKVERKKDEKVRYLTPQELELIKTADFRLERLRRVADCFLFSCYTGLSYGDMAELVPEDFQTNNYGMVYIEKKRKKTGIRFTTVLLDDALVITKKYDYQLPVISNQKTNAFLKEIQALCGIETNLTFHTARHTAASYLINFKPAIPQESIMQIFGWQSEKIYRHYAKLFNVSVFRDMRTVQQRLRMTKAIKKN